MRKDIIDGRRGGARAVRTFTQVVRKVSPGLNTLIVNQRMKWHSSLALLERIAGTTCSKTLLTR